MAIVSPNNMLAAHNQLPTNETDTVRRSGNYEPSRWGYEFVRSLRSEYVGEAYAGRVNKLKEDVRMILDKANPFKQLEIIDTLQRLGLNYHFLKEIKGKLNCIYSNVGGMANHDLYATALQFRLLRQNGFAVHQAIFLSFKDEEGNFKECLCEDLKGMLYLYEASFLSLEGENILDDAREFTTKYLKAYLKNNKNNGDYLSSLISHEIELPLHWRMPRLDSKWFISLYQKKHDMDPTLLELAILDFNMVQGTHHEDLRKAFSWWRRTGLREQLSFARDWLTENFWWAMGVISEPEYGNCRAQLAKVGTLITLIDDVYDVYGTLDELELLTDAIDRWDVNAMEKLPDYMKICFFGLYNCINEIAFDILKEKGFHAIPYLKKAWANLCKAYLEEAKWYYSGHTPTFKEYLQNGWISISGQVVLVHAYFLVTNPITEEGLELLWQDHPDSIIRISSTIFRLADDLGTSSDELERGDVPKGIQCHMREAGVSEEEAREYIYQVIGKLYKKMNENQLKNTVFSRVFMDMVINLPRMAQCIYQWGDGHRVQHIETKNDIIKLLTQPIPMTREE